MRIQNQGQLFSLFHGGAGGEGGGRRGSEPKARASLWEPTSWPDCSVSLRVLYELFHHYQLEKDSDRGNTQNMPSLTVFIETKRLTRPSILEGISSLHISEGFRWTQAPPIPIVCNKSFIIWKPELTFLSLPIQLFFHLANSRFFLSSFLWGMN